MCRDIVVWKGFNLTGKFKKLEEVEPKPLRFGFKNLTGIALSVVLVSLYDL